MTPAHEPAPPILWRRVFITLARRYGWGPEQIGNLTLGQLWIYWNEPRDGRRTVKLPPAESDAVVAARADERRRWVEEQLRRTGG